MDEYTLIEVLININRYTYEIANIWQLTWKLLNKCHLQITDE